MPRHPRLFLPNAIYHVYCRVARGEFVFDEDFQALEFVERLHLNPVSAGIVTDPAEYRLSGHRELIGLCRPYVIDRRSALVGFDDSSERSPGEEYLDWIRSVAEAHWTHLDVHELPWWENAKNVDEIADSVRHPTATLFDGRRLADERTEIDLTEFASRFEGASGHSLEDLASRYRKPHQIRGRIEFVTLALPRYGFRGRDVAALLGKHGNSVTKWLTQGLLLERDDPDFRNWLDRIDAAISSSR